MKITQLSVFLENRKGRLYEVCSLLGQNSVNIRALTIAETETFGVLRIVVDNPQQALKVFRDHHITANVTSVVAVEVDDRPGGLAAVLKTLSENNVNVEYMYGFVEKASDKAMLVFRFEDPDRATKVLTDNKIRVIGESDIRGL
jgi:hypothetical protein